MPNIQLTAIIGPTIGLLALIDAGPVQAFPGGAGTCFASAATITGMQDRLRNNPGDGPFEVVVDMMSQTYTPGGQHMVAITSADSSTFTGLLIYAETEAQSRVGSFDKSDSFIGSPTPTCSGDPSATASHTGLGPVAETTLMIPWTAPAEDVGPVTFRSIVLGGQRGSIGSQQFFFPATVTLQAMTAGEPDFQINQGIAGGWFDTATPGQGFLIDIEPASQFIFIAWFTYEAGAAKIGAEEHRWLTAQGNYDGNRAELSLFNTSGGAFDDPQGTQTDAAGSLVIEFSDCLSGSISYQIDDGGLAGDIALSRLIPGSEALCESLSEGPAR